MLDCEIKIETDDIKLEIRKGHIANSEEYVYHWFLCQKNVYFGTEPRVFTSMIKKPFLTWGDALSDFCEWYSKACEEIDKDFYELVTTILSNRYYDHF